MLFATTDGFVQRLDWSAALWSGLWAGLVAFTIGLSFLLWTRWGNYHVTAKCMIFSLLAHVVMGLFFATAEVVEDVVVALNTASTETPITIDRVQLVDPPDSSDPFVSESTIDGRTDEWAPPVWDRPAGSIALDSPSLSRGGPTTAEADPPQRSISPEVEPLPKRAPHPELRVAETPPDEPELTKPSAEGSERADVPVAPEELVASANPTAQESLPENASTRAAPKSESAPVKRVRTVDPSPPQTDVAAPGIDGSRVVPRIAIAGAANAPGAPSKPLSSPVRPGPVTGTDQETVAPSGPIASPEVIADPTARDRSSSASPSSEPSSSVRIGVAGANSSAPTRGSSEPDENADLLRGRAPVSARTGQVRAPGTTVGGLPRPMAVRPGGPLAMGGTGAGRQGIRLGTPEIYRERMNPNRSEQAVARGGSKASEEAVERALAWLAAHQHPDGHWDVDGFQAMCPAGRVCSGPGSQIRDDCAITGLVLLAFLGSGNTHWDGKYSTNVLNGLNWLLGQMKPSGDVRGAGRMYSQGIATLALSEALGMTGDPKLREAVERAVKFIVAAQNSSTGGWRYLPGQYGDTSIFGWQLMALKSASLAGIEVPEPTWQRASVWLNLVGSGRHRGLAAYQPTEQPTPPMTAEALACRVFLGQSTESPTLQEAADYLMQYPPQWHRENLYYWYYGTLACFQMGGSYWQRWNTSLRDMLIEHQVRDGHAAGSWDPNPTLDTWGKEGGRVYSTALATLCLEVYYRFLPIQSITGGDSRSNPSAASKPSRTESVRRAGRGL